MAEWFNYRIPEKFRLVKPNLNLTKRTCTKWPMTDIKHLTVKTRCIHHVLNHRKANFFSTFHSNRSCFQDTSLVYKKWILKKEAQITSEWLWMLDSQNYRYTKCLWMNHEILGRFFFFFFFLVVTTFLRGVGEQSFFTWAERQTYFIFVKYPFAILLSGPQTFFPNPKKFCFHFCSQETIFCPKNSLTPKSNGVSLTHKSQILLPF